MEKHAETIQDEYVIDAVRLQLEALLDIRDLLERIDNRIDDLQER
jgi:hypothetical protein